MSPRFLLTGLVLVAVAAGCGTTGDAGPAEGAPGKVVKEVSDHQIQVIKMSAVHYVENWKRHKSGLKRID